MLCRSLPSNIRSQPAWSDALRLTALSCIEPHPAVSSAVSTQSPGYPALFRRCVLMICRECNNTISSYQRSSARFCTCCEVSATVAVSFNSKNVQPSTSIGVFGFRYKTATPPSSTWVASYPYCHRHRDTHRHPSSSPATSGERYHPHTWFSCTCRIPLSIDLDSGLYLGLDLGLLEFDQV